MLIVADNRLPDSAKKNLESYGEVLCLFTSGITYPAVSCHPDIFLFQSRGQLIHAPNTPTAFLSLLASRNIPLKKGVHDVGKKYPATSRYNVAETDSYLIHHREHTDPAIVERLSGKEFLHVNQAYTRCNLVALKGNRFITSDRGIEKALQKKNLEVLYVDPEGILLPGYSHGFIGGSCGITGDCIFFIGSLDLYSEGDRIRAFASDYELVELYDGPLFDGGSLMFI